MKTFGIYAIINKKNRKMYIGQTKSSFSKRWTDHKTMLKKKVHHNARLQNAWNKYGELSFEFKKVHICDEMDILNDLERYYIKKYDTFNNGYNMTLGGDYLNGEMTEETRLKIVKSVRDAILKKSDFTEDQIIQVKELLASQKALTVKKIAEITGIGEKTIYNIKTLRSWTNIREDLNDIIKNNNDKEIRNNKIIEDLNTYNYTLNELSLKYDLSEENIRYILKKTNYAKIFKTVNDRRLCDKFKVGIENGITTYSEMEKYLNKTRATIKNCLTRQGLGDEYLKLTKKRKPTDMNSGCKGINYDVMSKQWYLRINFEGKQIPIGKFEYLKDAIDVKSQLEVFVENNDIDSIMEIKKLYTKPQCEKKKILCINLADASSIEIEGINVAGRLLGIPSNSISKVLRGVRKTTHGFTFKYVNSKIE